MEFTSSKHTFTPGILQVVGNPPSPRILTLGIFQISFIPSALRILMASASRYFSTLASSVGHLSFFSPIAISTIKSAGHFLFSIHASGVSMFTNFGLAHNKGQQPTFGNCHPFCLRKKSANYLGGCARRYVSSEIEWTPK